MNPDEFMKQQYLTLRDEIRTSKARIFALLIMGTIFVPVAAFVATQMQATYASISLPFIILVLMLGFIMEQNSIIRAGTYLKNHVEPHLESITTWEQWLESNHALRDMDRYFFGTFLLVFFLFYAIGTGLAIEALATLWKNESYYMYASVGYAIGGVWFVLVLLRHWRMCTMTD